MAFVGRQDRDEIGARHCLGGIGDAETRSVRHGDTGRARAKADDHIEPAIAQIERMGMALIAIADNGDTPASHDRRIGIAVGVDRQGHYRLSGRDRYRWHDAAGGGKLSSTARSP